MSIQGVICKCVVVAASMLAGSVFGGDVSSPAGAADAAELVDQSEKVCRREKVIGSNIPMTVCRTRAEMDAQADNARRELDRNRTRLSDG